MVTAELDEVPKAGLTPTGPVLDVMGVHEATLAAAGEATPPIAALQRPPERRWHGPGPAAHGQGPTVALQDPHHSGIAGQPPGGLGMQGGAPLELTDPARGIIGEGRRVHVHHDLVTVPAGPEGRTGSEHRVRHQQQRVGVGNRSALG